MSSIAAASALLTPKKNAVVRVVLPEQGGFLTVAWNKEKDIPEGKIPVAKDLMRKVLQSYSKRVLGLTTFDNEFDRRAALDFRPRRATDKQHDDLSDKVYDLYRFVVVKGNIRTVFKPAQPLVTLFDAGDDSNNSSLLRVKLGLWRSNWQEDEKNKPRRRTIATPRQLLLGRQLLEGSNNTAAAVLKQRSAVSDDDSDSDSDGGEDFQEDGWNNWDGVRVVSHRNNKDVDQWDSLNKKTSEHGTTSETKKGTNTLSTTKMKVITRTNTEAHLRRQTIDSGARLSNSSIKLSAEIAKMIQETGVVRDKRCTMLNLSGEIQQSMDDGLSEESTDLKVTENVNAEGEDELVFNESSPWSRKIKHGSRSSFVSCEMLEEPPSDSFENTSNLSTTTSNNSTSTAMTDSTKTDSTKADSTKADSTKANSTKADSTASKKRRRQHRRRMSALTDSSQHLLDDSLGTVLSMTSSPRNQSSSNNNNNSKKHGGTYKTNSNGTRVSAFVPEAGALNKLLNQPPPDIDIDNVATMRIQRIRQQIKDAEEFVACLPSVSFDVIKVNQLGRKQRRVLRVTSSCVLNCKAVKDVNNATKCKEQEAIDDVEGNQPMIHGGKPIKVTKSHHFDDVRNVTLKYHDALLIQYHNDHDFTYKSPVASSILHELGTRIAVSQATKKKKVQLQIAESLARRRTRKRGHEKLMSSSGMDRSEFRSQMTSSMTDIDVTNILSKKEEDDDEGGEEEEEEEEEEEVGLLVSVSSSKLVKKGGGEHCRTTEERGRRSRSKRASKLAKLTGETEEQRLEVVLRRLIYNPESDVGRTRTHFLKSFVESTGDKTPSDALKHIRLFIDGMQQYIMQHYANDQNCELGRLLVEVSFTDDHVDKRSNTSMVLEARSSGSGKTTLAEIVMRSCEESLFPHLWDEQVLPLLSSLVDSKEEDTLVKKMSSKLEGLPQSFFEIPKSCESPSRWSAAALEMAGISSAIMPTDKLAALLRAAKVIYGTYAAEKELREKRLKKSTPKGKKVPKMADELGADEFLPIFIFVIVHAGLESPLRDKECMWSLCEPDMVAGEGGYYLTVFDAALSYLKVCDSGE